MEVVRALARVFTCDKCDGLFTTQDPLEDHRLSKHHHKRQGKHRCAYCSYSSDWKTSVTRHERLHTGERPFLCKDCGRRFTREDHLAGHSLVHSGEKPHGCAVCGKRYRQAAHLTKHRRKKHSVGVGLHSNSASPRLEGVHPEGQPQQAPDEEQREEAARQLHGVPEVDQSAMSSQNAPETETWPRVRTQQRALKGSHKSRCQWWC